MKPSYLDGKKAKRKTQLPSIQILGPPELLVLAGIVLCGVQC